MPNTDVKRRAASAYAKRSARYYGFNLVISKDDDILQRLSEEPSIQGYLKALIREDIALHSADSTDNAPPPFEK